MIDTASLLASVDLGALITADLGRPRKSGRWLMWRCPFHAGDDTASLSATPDNGRWHCFGCGKGGDAIAWLREREGLSFPEACARLGAGDYRLACPRPTPLPCPTPHAGPPSPEWQAQARRVIETCEAELWAASGGRALAYLRQRGLQPDTLRHWRIGFNPEGREFAGLWVPRGIVIPCEIEGAIWYLKVRRPPGSDPKYKHVGGGRPALFGADTLAGHTVAVFTEGEFDALLLWQAAGDLAGIVTLGSARKGLDPAEWARYLLLLSPYLIAYDMDSAGAGGAEALAELTARARCVSVPRLRPHDKDLTDYHRAGGNLREWLREEIWAARVFAERGIPDPAT